MAAGSSLRGHLTVVTRLQDMHRDDIIPRVAFIHPALISATNLFLIPAHGYGGAGAVARTGDYCSMRRLETG